MWKISTCLITLVILCPPSPALSFSGFDGGNVTRAPAMPGRAPLPPQRVSSAGGNAGLQDQDGPGITTMLRSIYQALIRLESSLLLSRPCNTTDCDVAPATAPAQSKDWRLGRHHYGLRRQILQYSPTAPMEWGTPGPDGFYDSDPDEELPALRPSNTRAL